MLLGEPPIIETDPGRGLQREIVSWNYRIMAERSQPYCDPKYPDEMLDFLHVRERDYKEHLKSFSLELLLILPCLPPLIFPIRRSS